MWDAINGGKPKESHTSTSVSTSASVSAGVDGAAADLTHNLRIFLKSREMEENYATNTKVRKIIFFNFLEKFLENF